MIIRQIIRIRNCQKYPCWTKKGGFNVIMNSTHYTQYCLNISHINKSSTILHCPLYIIIDACCNERNCKQRHCVAQYSVTNRHNNKDYITAAFWLKYDTGWYWHNFRYLNVNALDKQMQSICYMQLTSRKQQRHID